MTLLEPHRQKLLACGLTLETWSGARLHSGSADEVRDTLGYGVQGGGLIIPYDESYARVRIDHPGPDGKRYRSPKGGANRLYVPPTLLPVLSTPAVALYLTEGEFKALKATQDGFPCLALPGVWSWKTRLHGQSFPIPDFDRVVWKARRVVVVFDSDLADKPTVAWAEHALIQELRSRGADVHVLRLPDGPKGEKVGLDDYLVAHGADPFRQLPMRPAQETDDGPPVFLRVSDMADAYLLRAGQPHHRIQLGYQELDAHLRGIAPGEVCTIIARPGVGKTAFALNLIDRMATAEQLPTLMFSLEQQGTEILERLASMLTGWPGRELEERARDEDPELTARLRDVCERWSHVVFVERPCALEQIDRLLSEARSSTLWPAPLRLVVVDYLGMIGQSRQSNAYEQVSRVARELKNFAKKHRAALVVLCQVDREGGSGGEPLTLKMARDSGVIEEAADYLLGLWRPELKDGLTKDQRNSVRGQFVIRVLKNRSGPAPKTVTLHFDSTSLRISAPDVPTLDESGWVRT